MIHVNRYYEIALNFCPECGKPLERNLTSGWKACFLHGDFEIDEGVLIWGFTKNLINREAGS